MGYGNSVTRHRTHRARFVPDQCSAKINTGNSRIKRLCGKDVGLAFSAISNVQCNDFTHMPNF
jgi:hypothetical protein